MKTLTRASGLFVLACLANVLIGCGGFNQAPSAAVPIASIDRVAGKWEGMAKKAPEMWDHSWVWLTIQDNGTYQFMSENVGTLSLGAGVFTLRNGRLTSETDERSGTVTLYELEKEQVLGADVTFKNGERYAVEMSRAD